METLAAFLTSCACLLGAVAASYGQGQIGFANNTSQTPVTFGNVAGTSYAADTGQRAWGPASTFEYALYLGPVGATSYTQMTLIDTTFNPTSTSGTAFTAGVDGGVTVSGTGNTGATITAGQTYSDIVLGWTTKDGSSFDAAVASGDPNGLTGMSPLVRSLRMLLPHPPAKYSVPLAGVRLALESCWNQSILLNRRRSL